MKLIDKDAVVAEIERIKNEECPTDTYEGRCKLLWFEQFLSFLDTLEVKEVDLEEKATQLSQKYFPDAKNIWVRPNIEAHKCKSACIEMVEWFKENLKI